MTSWKAGQISFKLGSTPRPRDAEADNALLTRVLETARGGDIDAATGLAETALADGLEHPLLLNLVAGRRVRWRTVVRRLAARPDRTHHGPGRNT